MMKLKFSFRRPFSTFFTKAAGEKKKGKGKGKNGKGKNQKPEEEAEEEMDENDEMEEDEEEPGMDSADEEQMEAGSDGGKTPEWVNSEGEETTPPEDEEEHEVSQLIKESEAEKTKAKAKAKAKGKAKAKAKAKAKVKADKENAAAKAKSKATKETKKGKNAKEDDGEDDEGEEVAEEFVEEEEPRKKRKTGTKKSKDRPLARHAKRMLKIGEKKECLRLQGLSSGLHDAAQELGVSDAKLKAACGNAWPVNLVAKLIQNMGLEVVVAAAAAAAVAAAGAAAAAEPLNARQLANVSWALAISNLEGGLSQALAGQLAVLVVQRISECSAQGVSTLAWAFGCLEVEGPVFGALAGEAVAKMNHSTGQGLALLTWSFSKESGRLTKEQLLRFLAALDHESEDRLKRRWQVESAKHHQPDPTVGAPSMTLAPMAGEAGYGEKTSPAECQTPMEQVNSWKEDGNGKLSSGDLVAAVEAYSHGIDLCHELKIIGKPLGVLYVNRAQANLRSTFHITILHQLSPCPTGAA
eukprot:symbB.v1.2.009853.t1/scaffold637.1/size178048/4